MSSSDPNSCLEADEKLLHPVTKCAPRQYQLVYKNVLLFFYYHLAGLYGLYVVFTSAKWQTISLAVVILLPSIVGVTAGAHRLWSHRSYRAHWSLQLLLMLCHCASGQGSLHNWARDHRLHHKYSDTDADPHNASRGFFFSHIGWLLVRKHPEVKKRGANIDVSDLRSDAFVMFHHRNRNWFVPLIAVVLPTLIPVQLWGESLFNAWHITMLRYAMGLNMVFTINSCAHLWGYRPYDKHIAPTVTLTLFYLTLGEGSHNFHHTFPTDYRSDGLGLFNVVTRFIDACAMLGLVRDRKVTDDEVVRARVRRTGDGSFY